MDLTLIIPTYNRPQYLQKLLNYYANKTTMVRFIILDSSDELTQRHNKEYIEKLSNQFQHYVFSHDMRVAEKLAQGLNLVTTEFCAFCADDDLVFLDGLQKAKIELQNNPHYSCVDGIYLNFNPIKNDLHLIIEYASQGIHAENHGARIFNLMQKYESLFYGVFRTQDAQRIFQSVKRISSLHYQELFQATSTLLLGKSQRLPIFYAARQHCEPAEKTRDKWQTYYWFAENSNEFLTHYMQYRTALWEFYQQQLANPLYKQEDFFKLIDVTHAMYFGVNCPPAYFHTTLNAHWPHDEFKKIDKMQNICLQLKSPMRKVMEKQVERFCNWLTTKVENFYSKQDLKKLNSQMQSITKQPWHCVLSPELNWLCSVEDFKAVYQELCFYMSQPTIINEKKEFLAA